jgi:transcriptional regulator NrdR family protein
MRQLKKLGKVAYVRFASVFRHLSLAFDHPSHHALLTFLLQ